MLTFAEYIIEVATKPIPFRLTPAQRKSAAANMALIAKQVMAQQRRSP